jgi:putative ABC transport system permease protein
MYGIMNFLKRAGYSLIARPVRTSLLLGVFIVISALLLAGFMLRDAMAREQAEAARSVGVDVTVTGRRLTDQAAERLGQAPGVVRFDILANAEAALKGALPVPAAGAAPATLSTLQQSQDRPLLSGVDDSGLLLGFDTGRDVIVSGRGITPADGDRPVVMVEEQLAERNRLHVGDGIALESADGDHATAFQIVGIYRSPQPVPPVWVPLGQVPADQLYAPAGAVEKLDPGIQPADALYRLGDPSAVPAFRGQAASLVGGSDLNLAVNAAAYETLVGPMQAVAGLAGGVVWLIAGSGALILALIVALGIRDRREELGVLLSLGERKPRILGQHIVEVVAAALLAQALAVAVALAFAPAILDPILAHSTTGSRPPVSQAAHLDPAETVTPVPASADTADVLWTAGICLGICLVGTAVPGTTILRLSPRSVLVHAD